MMNTTGALGLAFDQYQRYAAVAQVADLVRNHLQRAHLRVLDVGGFLHTQLGHDLLPLAQFLPTDEVVGVDLETDPVPNYAVASGMALPFSSQAFDFVTSCDTLEHVQSAHRSAFVDELLRVARHYLVLTAPFDSEPTHRAERILYDYMVTQGVHHPQLQEHLDNGLPSATRLRRQLASQGLKAISFADGYLPNWLAMMVVKHTPGLSLDFQIDLDRYYNRHVAAFDRREPSYRQVFVVAKPGYEDLLPSIASAATSKYSSAFPKADFATDLGHVLQRGLALAPMATKQRADRQLADARTRLAALETENARLRHLVDGYEGGRFIRFMRWLHEQRDDLQRRFVHK